MKIAIIGGGAAGMFCAANIESKNAEITILESGRQVLRKVEQSGGGRCNITNSEPDMAKFIKNYPRGGGRLRKPLTRFGPNELSEWFRERAVELVEEDEGRVFPKSENSLEVADCLMRACKKRGTFLRMPFTAHSVELKDGGFSILGKYEEKILADIIVFAGGGHWNEGLQEFLEKLGHTFVPPCPSLFAFKTNYKKLTELAGIGFKNTALRCPALKIETHGGVLITHEGLTGPAVLKMSSIGAREFQSLDYSFKVEFAAIADAQNFKNFCDYARKSAPKKLVKNFYPESLPRYYWAFCLEKIGCPENIAWAHFSAEMQKKLGDMVCGLEIQITGRAVNAREFVTCGGLSLNDVDFTTMQSKKHPGLFFAGECLDIDGFTGGFNLQAAWTTAYIAAKAIEGLNIKEL